MREGPSDAARLAGCGLSLAAAVAAFSNGTTFSPLFDSVLYQLQLLAAPLPVNSNVLFYGTSVFLGLATLALGGVPAALYERWRGHARTTPVSAVIWLAATIMLALPGLLGAIGYFEFE